MSELKPCPFCGSENVKLRTEHWICYHCGATAYWSHNTRPIEDELQARITQLTSERDDWKADAERLATKHLDLYNSCVHCGHHKYSGMDHAIDCPITLHRELVAKYGGEHE